MGSVIPKATDGEGANATDARFFPADSNDIARARFSPRFDRVPDCSSEEEDLAHYLGSEARIGDFPTQPLLECKSPQQAPLVETVTKKFGVSLRLKLLRSGFACSVLLHIFVATALAFVVVPKMQDAEIQGAMTVAIVIEGTSDVDQQMAGGEQSEDEPVVKREAVAAQQSSLPAAAAILEGLPLPQIAGEAPEILTSTSPAEEKVAAAARIITRDDRDADPLRKPETSDVQLKLPVKQVDETRPAEKKPITKIVEKSIKKLNEKPKRKERKKPLGNQGSQQTSSRRGSEEAQSQGEISSKNSKGTGRIADTGNAARSNYAGLVQKRLGRAKGRVRSSGRGSLVLVFTIQANGGVSNVRVARSSGSEKLDHAALAMVKKAAPFPPIPAETGKTSWKMTVPIDFK